MRLLLILLFAATVTHADLPKIDIIGDLIPPTPYVQPNGFAQVEWNNGQNGVGRLTEPRGKHPDFGWWAWAKIFDNGDECVILMSKQGDDWRVTGFLKAGGNHWDMPGQVWKPGNAKYAGVKIVNGQPAGAVDFWVNVGDTPPPS